MNVTAIAQAKRISITGNSGSGKSTAALTIGAILEHPVVHLDRLYWKAPDVPVPEDHFRDSLDEALAGPCWIIEGFHIQSARARFAAADVLIFLDVPAPICAWRLLLAWRRSWPGTPDGGARMTLRSLFGFLRWVWIFPSDRRPRTLAALRAYPDKLVVLRSSREVARFVRDLRQAVGK